MDSVCIHITNGVLFSPEDSHVLFVGSGAHSLLVSIIWYPFYRLLFNGERLRWGYIAKALYMLNPETLWCLNTMNTICSTLIIIEGTNCDTVVIQYKVYTMNKHTNTLYSLYIIHLYFTCVLTVNISTWTWKAFQCTSNNK